MRVAIIGMGVIGKAQADMFYAHELVPYDPATHGVYPLKEIASCDFAIVCVGTPEAADGGADLSYVEKAARKLPPHVPMMLRSTVPPGTTDRLFGDRDLYCHAPEFMGENRLHSWQRSQDVPYMIVGGRPEASRWFHEMMVGVFPGTIHECSAVESELAKYAANLYWANRVTFVNEFAKVCEAFGADYENVRAAWLSDPRMSPEYTRRAGYPAGFDGRCWPKDLAALISASWRAGYEAEFLQAISDSNERFRTW